MDQATRGEDRTSGTLFSYVDLDARVPRSHPPRRMRELVNASLATLDSSFQALYAGAGRPSIPPEKPLKTAPASPNSRKLTSEAASRGHARGFSAAC